MGSGWLGLPLTKHLSRHGYTIKASTRHKKRFEEIRLAGATPYVVDIDQLSTAKEFLLADILIINITSKNLMGFRQLIRQIEESPIRKVLFISSTSVYQNVNEIVTEATDSEDQNNMLWQLEQLFFAHTLFETTILRFSGLIDNRRHPGRFFLNGRRIPQANAPVNLIHLDDCIGIITAVLQQQAWGEVFNGSADTHPIKRDFYGYARSLLSLPEPEFDEFSELQFKLVSNSKVKIKLGYQFKHPDLMNIKLS